LKNLEYGWSGLKTRTVTKVRVSRLSPLLKNLRLGPYRYVYLHTSKLTCPSYLKLYFKIVSYFIIFTVLAGVNILKI
jgi:hypothetical protein